MAYYQPFSPTGVPFHERAVVSEVETAIGLLIINFQELEAVIGTAVGACVGADAKTTLVLTVELSFKTLVHLLGSLTRAQASGQIVPLDSGARIARLDELLGLCLCLEGERNRLTHSFWPAQHQDMHRALRMKWTAKKDGLREQREELDASRILDTADYASYLASMIEEYFDLPFGAADGRVD